MRAPLATYRLQFRGTTTFARAAALAGYLARLGIDTLYASPLTQAVPGSSHGYDGVDYNRLDPALGTREDFDAMVAALRREGIGLLLDIVPNHLAATPFNPWWRDVLEWGAASRYAGHFAVDWNAERLLVPVLGCGYGEALERGELGLAFDARDGGISFRYHDIRLPLTPPTYAQVLARYPDQQQADLARRFAVATPEHSEELKAELAGSAAAAALPAVLDELARDRDALHELHESQIWRLSHWRLAREMLTYRRFFEIADLVGVLVESKQVFDDVHGLVDELAARGQLAGLRIDHIDGLADPQGYLRRLDEEIAGPSGLYVVVEKILAAGEQLPATWKIAGTTGYEMIAGLSGLFVDASREEEMSQAYAGFVGAESAYAALVRGTKRMILSRNLAGELETLKDQVRELAARDPRTRDLGPDTLRRALIELAAAMPVYRTYVSVEGPGEDDRALLDQAAASAKGTREIEDEAAIDFLVSVLCLDLARPEDQAAALGFTTRFQQSTAPIMAKAVEDTLFYRYSRLLCLNEVGSAPDRYGAPVADFHAAMARRLATWPDGLSATSTHDTKRGEDARARLYALSEMPGAWAEAVARWSRHNAPLRRAEGEATIPGPDLEWMFYQALLGAWPPELAAGDRDGVAGLATRLAGFMLKAVREAKLKTSWTAPDPDYEAAVTGFVGGVLSGELAAGFLNDFLEVCRPVVVAGALTGLAQTAAKLAAPGVPDIYQGAELWDLSLVDPDNRRPVDFELRERLLAGLERDAGVDTILAGWRSGLAKLHLLRQGLALRRRLPDVFRRGAYAALDLTGERAGHAIGFARTGDGGAVVAVLPRLVLGLVGDQERPLVPPERWGDTCVMLPDTLPGRWHNVLTGDQVAGPRLPLGRLLAGFPVALLAAEER